MMNIGQYNAQQYNTSRASQYCDLMAVSRVSTGRRVIGLMVRNCQSQCRLIPRRAIKAIRSTRLAVTAYATRLTRKLVRTAIARFSVFRVRTTQAARYAVNAKAYSARQPNRAIYIGRLAVSMASIGAVERFKAMVLSPAVSTVKSFRTSLIAVNTLSSAISGGVVAWAQRVTEARRTAKATTEGIRRVIVSALRRGIASPTKPVAQSIVDKWIATVLPTLIRLEAVITRIQKIGSETGIAAAQMTTRVFRLDQVTVVVKVEKQPANIINERDK